MGYKRACQKNEDVVEVVRCKDCKHSQYDKVADEYICALRTKESDAEYLFYSNADWFCADGELKY